MGVVSGVNTAKAGNLNARVCEGFDRVMGVYVTV